MSAMCFDWGAAGVVFVLVSGFGVDVAASTALPVLVAVGTSFTVALGASEPVVCASVLVLAAAFRRAGFSLVFFSGAAEGEEVVGIAAGPEFAISGATVIGRKLCTLKNIYHRHKGLAMHAAITVFEKFNQASNPSRTNRSGELVVEKYKSTEIPLHQQAPESWQRVRLPCRSSNSESLARPQPPPVQVLHRIA